MSKNRFSLCLAFNDSVIFEDIESLNDFVAGLDGVLHSKLLSYGSKNYIMYDLEIDLDTFVVGDIIDITEVGTSLGRNIISQLLDFNRNELSDLKPNMRLGALSALVSQEGEYTAVSIYPNIMPVL